MTRGTSNSACWRVFLILACTSLCLYYFCRSSGLLGNDTGPVSKTGPVNRQTTVISANDIAKNDNSSDASGTDVTDAEIDAAIAKTKAEGGGLAVLADQPGYRDLQRKLIAREKSGIALKPVASLRDTLTRPVGKLEPLMSHSELAAMIKDHNTPAAFAIAAGASRESAWLEKGLQVFPSDPFLLRASALFDWRYLQEPSTIEAWKNAEPKSGLPFILEADDALSRQDPKAAYEAIAAAMEREILFDSEGNAEIQEFLLENGLHYKDKHFQDINKNENNITKRIMLLLRDAAGKSNDEGDPTGAIYYAAAALALSDLRTGSGNSATAANHAEGASQALKLLGPERAAPFLAGQTYDDALKHYADIAAHGKAASTAGEAYMATLEGEAMANFDRLRNQFGSAKALEMVRKP